MDPSFSISGDPHDRLKALASMATRTTEMPACAAMLNETKALLDKIGADFKPSDAGNLNTIAQAGKQWKLGARAEKLSSQSETNLTAIITAAEAAARSSGIVSPASSSSSSSTPMSSESATLSPRLLEIINLPVENKETAEAQLTLIEAFIDARSSSGVGFSREDKMHIFNFEGTIGNWDETYGISDDRLNALTAKIATQVNPTSRRLSPAEAPVAPASGGEPSSFSKLMAYVDRIGEMKNLPITSTLFLEIDTVLMEIRLSVAVDAEQANKLMDLRDELESWRSEIIALGDENGMLVDRSVAKINQILGIHLPQGAGIPAAEPSTFKPSIWNAWGLFGR